MTRESAVEPRRPASWWQAVAGLALLALLAGGLVTSTERWTRERIEGNQSLQTLRQLNRVLPPDLYDNDLHVDRIELLAPQVLGSREPLPAWRARLDGRPSAAVLTVVAPNGYNGPISMLVALRPDGRIIGVRVTGHKETPGIGDAIEDTRSDWILGFSGRSLQQPPEHRWRLTVDGGDIDHISGASMSSRTITSALRRTLVYFAANQEQIFAAPAMPGTTDAEPAP
jgi:electron transport complex protein RnfG